MPCLCDTQSIDLVVSNYRNNISQKTKKSFLIMSRISLFLVSYSKLDHLEDQSSRSQII